MLYTLPLALSIRNKLEDRIQALMKLELHYLSVIIPPYEFCLRLVNYLKDYDEQDHYAYDNPCCEEVDLGFVEPLLDE